MRSNVDQFSELRRTFVPGQTGKDQVSLSEQRFARLKGVFPAGAPVGYATGPEGYDPGAFFLTQYALAPTIIDPFNVHPVVLGNFTKGKGGKYHTFAGPPMILVLRQEYGDGLKLFELEQ
jgi:hypothetical protein